MNDILASLELLNHKPAHFTVVGIKPVELADYGGSLTEPVQSQMPAALQLGIDELRRWGVEVRERDRRPERDVVISALRQDLYESGRPSPTSPAASATSASWRSALRPRNAATKRPEESNA